MDSVGSNTRKLILQYRSTGHITALPGIAICTSVLSFVDRKVIHIESNPSYGEDEITPLDMINGSDSVRKTTPEMI